MIYTLKIFHRGNQEPLTFQDTRLQDVIQTMEDTLESSLDHYNIVRMEVTWSEDWPAGDPVA